MAFLYDRDENNKIKSTVYAILKLKMSQSLCLRLKTALYSSRKAKSDDKDGDGVLAD